MPLYVSGFWWNVMNNQALIALHIEQIEQNRRRRPNWLEYKFPNIQIATVWFFFDSIQPILLIFEIMLLYRVLWELVWIIEAKLQFRLWTFYFRKQQCVRRCPKIRHFSCERDFYFLRNQKTISDIMRIRHYSSQTISLKRLEVMIIRHFHVNKTWIARKCVIRMISEFLIEIEWLERCLINVILKSLSQEKCLILWTQQYFDKEGLIENSNWIKIPNAYMSKLFGTIPIMASFS